MTIIFLLLFSLTINAKPNQHDIRPKISRIVDKLKKDNYVHFGYAVGYGAVRETKNKYYDCFKIKSKSNE